jgi:hypothetical protein
MSGWVAGAVVVGAAVGAYATSQAADAQASAAEQAAQTSAGAQVYSANLQKQMFDKQIELQKPWYDVGVRALPKLEAQAGAMPSAFTGQVNLGQDPGYAFRLAEGQKALERSAAARGGLISGSALKAAQRYGQEMGSQEYGNAYQRALDVYNAAVQRESTGYNRLASLAGVGQTTAQQLGQAGQQYGANASNLAMTNAANQGNALLAAGQARSSAYQGYGSAAGQAFGGIGNYLQNYNRGGYVSGTGYTTPSPSGPGIYNVGGGTMEINALPG